MVMVVDRTSLPPATVTCDSIHLRNRESKQLVDVSNILLVRRKWSHTPERSSNDGGREEERQTPLQLVTLVIHGDELDAA